MSKALATNGTISIVGIQYDIIDSVELDSGEHCEIFYDVQNSEPYFILNDVKYYLDEFIRLD